jgi:hypothetical protein
MTQASHELARYEPLIAALLSAFAASPGPRPRATLPAGRREEVVGLLTRLVADPPLFDAYVGRVRTLRRNLGAEAELRLLGGAESDVPWEQVAARGFAGLPDDVLADLATSPEALEAFDEEHVQTGDDLGPWFFDAVERHSAPLDPIEAQPKQPLSPSVPSVTPAAPRPRGGRFLRWAVPAGLAAGLLLGGLGGWLVRGPGEKKGEPVAMSGSAAFEPLVTRGPNQGALQVRVSSSADGFVVVIELSPDLNQFFRPEPGKHIPASRGGQSEGIPLRASTTRIVYAVTETPAGETIRLAFAPKETRVYRADQYADLKRDLEDLLTKKGFKNFTVGTEAIPTAP